MTLYPLFAYVVAIYLPSTAMSTSPAVFAVVELTISDGAGAGPKTGRGCCRHGWAGAVKEGWGCSARSSGVASTSSSLCGNGKSGSSSMSDSSSDSEKLWFSTREVSSLSERYSAMISCVVLTNDLPGRRSVDYIIMLKNCCLQCGLRLSQ